jgi:hypothetical protein
MITDSHVGAGSAGDAPVIPDSLLRGLIAVAVSRLLACSSGCLGEFVEHSHDTELEVEAARTVTDQKGTDAWQPRRTLIGRSGRVSATGAF